MGTDSESPLERVDQQFYDALNANLGGNMGPMREVWSHEPDISNMGPFGGCLVGPNAVLGQFERESRMGIEGRVVAIDTRMVVAGDMAYSVCVETGTLSIAGNSIDANHRATNIFRREHGVWKLVHHHTDLSPSLGQ